MLTKNEYKVSPCPTSKQTGAVHDISPAKVPSAEIFKTSPVSRYIYPISDTRWDEAVHPLCIILQHTSSHFFFAKLSPNFKMATFSSNQGYVRLLMELVNAIDNLVTGTAIFGAVGK